MSNSAASRPYGASQLPLANGRRDVSSSRLPTKMSKHPTDPQPPSFSTIPTLASRDKGTGKAKLKKRNVPESVTAPGIRQERGVVSDKSGKFTDASLGADSRVQAPVYVSMVDRQEQESRARTLRRKPSVIGNYISRMRATQTEELALPTQSARPSQEISRAPYSVQEMPSRIDTTSSPLDFSHRGTPQPGYTAQIHDFYHQNNPSIQTRTPISATSATPSLLYSESPGAFSYNTTPTSRTSHSPQIHASPHIGPYAWSSPSKGITEYDARAQVRLRSDSFTSAEGRPGSSSQSLVGTVPLSAGPRARTPLTMQQSSLKTTQSHGLAESALPRITTRTTSKPSKIPASSLAESSAPQRPPELAHLMNEQSNTLSRTPQVPERPKFDAKNEPLVHAAPSPVIYSNLPRLNTTRHRRQSSSSNAESALSSADSSNRPMHARPSGTFSRSQISRDSPSLPSTEFAKSLATTNPEETAQSSKNEATSETVTLNGSSPVGKSTSRFGFFSRKPKQPKEAKVQEDSKSTRKGPMAGTGHEGYRQYAVRGRNGSSAVSSRASSRATTASPNGYSSDTTTQSKDGAGVDDFLSQRLNPIYIRGDGSASSVELPTNSDFQGARRQREAGADVTLTTQPELKLLSANASTTSVGSLLRPRRSESADGRDSLDQDISADERKGSHWHIFSKPSSTPKPANKWNFFHRAQTNDAEESEPIKANQVLRTDAQDPIQPIAHYAMLGGQEKGGIEELEGLMQEVDAAKLESLRANRLLTSSSFGSAWSESRTSFECNTSATNSAIDLSPQISSTDLPARVADASIQPLSTINTSASTSTPEVEQPKQSRLKQVGRIPAVVPSGDRVRRPSDQSFSRPFISSPPQRKLETQNGSSFHNVQHQRRDSSPAKGLASVHASAIITNHTLADNAQPTEPEIRFDINPAQPREFISISPRKNSEISQSSGSISLYFPTAATTAVIPSAMSPQSDDEIWEEYDDLIDNVLTPTSTLGERADNFEDNPKVESSKVSNPVAKSKTLFPNLAAMARELRPLSVTDERRSKLSIENATAGDVESEKTLQEQSRTNTVNVAASNDRAVRTSGSSTRSKTRNSVSSNQSISKHSDEEATRRTGDTKESLLAVSDNLQNRVKSVHMKFDPQSMANLRFGALMTSKWLSFGRVLFSPAHFEMNNLNEDRILVIDGLGKDWSYYCALTYSNASVYSLGPSPSKGKNRNSLGGWQALPNYRHFSHLDLSANFPFPKNFFAAVVFRFPTATSDAKLRTAITECKRVLRPGGFIEISALDLDLANMGNRCRRAIRALKVQMRTAVPEVSLKPASDNIQHMLGRRGFENLNRCIVSLPAAGVISDSRDQSIDGTDPSFTDLMKDQSKEGDEGITKMVARVGRWWYSRCYESAVLSNGDLSLSFWNDIALLRECEKRQTAFKLLSCYAQKPTVAKRRTVSL